MKYGPLQCMQDVGPCRLPLNHEGEHAPDSVEKALIDETREHPHHIWEGVQVINGGGFDGSHYLVMSCWCGAATVKRIDSLSAAVGRIL